MGELSKPHPDSSSLQLNVIYNQWGNPSSSWVALLDYILINHKNPDDIIYLLEDDYLHQPDWLEKFAGLIQSNIHYDYLSLYDHGDNYTLPTHKRFNTELFHTKTHIWRTIFSTCGSFITRVRNIQEDELALKALPDFQLFLHLSMHGRVLLAAIPGLSTHAMTGLESPGVDWHAISLQD
jgi:glycosyltransferase involved in cell wall biosynthesis